jgi:hypothetical protein
MGRWWARTTSRRTFSRLTLVGDWVRERKALCRARADFTAGVFSRLRPIVPCRAPHRHFGPQFPPSEVRMRGSKSAALAASRSIDRLRDCSRAWDITGPLVALEPMVQTGGELKSKVAAGDK